MQAVFLQADGVVGMVKESNDSFEITFIGKPAQIIRLMEEIRIFFKYKKFPNKYIEKMYYWNARNKKIIRRKDYMAVTYTN
ncbi:MAG: hypothetical protein ACTSYD_01465 [Candidatus Heimdallarchaeaceae archaeon]